MNEHVQVSSLHPGSVLQSLGIDVKGTNPGLLYSNNANDSGFTLGNDKRDSTDVVIASCPTTGAALAKVEMTSSNAVEDVVSSAYDAYKHFRSVPAPERGAVLLTIRSLLAKHKDDLGALISLEMGKAISEGRGEIQEGIDICDYAIGLSRMLSGKVVPSERRDHFLMESPNPLGVVLVISAFNFPHAVFLWNFALSFVCGNATIWKPAPTANLIAAATTKLIHQALVQHNLPLSLASLCCANVEASKALVAHDRISLVSFTGSEAIGRIVAGTVASRLGKSLLELGGNSAIVILPDGDMDLALQTVLFGAVGTAGQRCTTTRRLLLHQDIAESFVERLSKAYKSLISTQRIGDPLDTSMLMGPVHTLAAVKMYDSALKEAVAQGGKLLCGGGQVEHKQKGYEKGNWVQPALIYYGAKHPPIMEEETFAPILHVSTFTTLEQGIELNNSVRQGLGSSLFTKSMQSVFKWLGPAGSDCGIVNVNQSSSGAEIGCGFGGNKATGWGRESGGDAWKQYCSWKSATVNFGNHLGLAQGLKFE